MMKKFLTCYFILILFLFFLLILLFGVKKSKEDVGEQEPQQIDKKIIVIITEEFEPMGRVICQTPNGIMFSDWKSAEDAVSELEEMKKYYKDNKNYFLYIQYNKRSD